MILTILKYIFHYFNNNINIFVFNFNNKKIIVIIGNLLLPKQIFTALAKVSF